MEYIIKENEQNGLMQARLKDEKLTDFKIYYAERLYINVHKILILVFSSVLDKALDVGYCIIPKGCSKVVAEKLKELIYLGRARIDSGDNKRFAAVLFLWEAREKVALTVNTTAETALATTSRSSAETILDTTSRSSVAKVVSSASNQKQTAKKKCINMNLEKGG